MVLTHRHRKHSGHLVAIGEGCKCKCQAFSGSLKNALPPASVAYVTTYILLGLTSARNLSTLFSFCNYILKRYMSKTPPRPSHCPVFDRLQYVEMEGGRPGIFNM